MAVTRSQAKGTGGGGGVSTQDLQDTIGAFDEETTLEQLRQGISQFVEERDWDQMQFHTPRNLLLAMVGEVGELAELFQWRGDAANHLGLESFSDRDKVLVGEELSDVLLYLLRLSHQCNVNLPRAAQRKLKLNARKYPADKARGKSAKYTEYVQESTEGQVDMASRYSQLRRRRISNNEESTRTNEKDSGGQDDQRTGTGATEQTEEGEHEEQEKQGANEEADEIVANIEIAQESVLSIENILAFLVGMGFMYLFSSGKVQQLLIPLIDWIQGT